MTTERIIGFLLLGIGVVIIFYALYASYGIFTGSQEPPEVYGQITSSQNQRSSSVPDDVQQQIDGLIENQLQRLLPADSIPKTLNLFAWSILTGILIFGGGQIAGIGVKLVKK